MLGHEKNQHRGECAPGGRLVWSGDLSWVGGARPASRAEGRCACRQARTCARRARQAVGADRALPGCAPRTDAPVRLEPGKVAALQEWLASHGTLKGTDLQDAATKSGFEPSFVALALFPQVVDAMAGDLEWTKQIGAGVRCRPDRGVREHPAVAGEGEGRRHAEDHAAAGRRDRTTSSGQQVIVIEPANPQVVYVPQYNPQVVYTQPASAVVVQESSNADAVAAGLIGFTAGIAIGAAMDNDYYYGPYGWHGGGYMYNDAWDD